MFNFLILLIITMSHSNFFSYYFKIYKKALHVKMISLLFTKIIQSLNQAAQLHLEKR